MQQRRDEILAKKAKLAELKRQRELRASQATASRQSITSDVSKTRTTLCFIFWHLVTDVPVPLLADLTNPQQTRESPRDRIVNQEPGWR